MINKKSQKRLVIRGRIERPMLMTKKTGNLFTFVRSKLKQLTIRARRKRIFWKSKKLLILNSRWCSHSKHLLKGKLNNKLSKVLCRDQITIKNSQGYSPKILRTQFNLQTLIPKHYSFRSGLKRLHFNFEERDLVFWLYQFIVDHS